AQVQERQMKAGVRLENPALDPQRAQPEDEAASQRTMTGDRVVPADRTVAREALVRVAVDGAFAEALLERLERKRHRAAPVLGLGGGEPAVLRVVRRHAEEVGARGHAAARAPPKRCACIAASAARSCTSRAKFGTVTTGTRRGRPARNCSMRSDSPRASAR